MQRYSNEVVRSVDGHKVMPFATDGRALRNLESQREAHPGTYLKFTHIQAGGASGDAKGSTVSPSLSQGLLNASAGAEQQAVQSSSPSTVPFNLSLTQFPISTGISKPTDEGKNSSKGSRSSHGPLPWLGSLNSPNESTSTVPQLFAKPVSRAVDNMADVPVISLSTVSQGLESGRSLSQLLPALRNSLQGAQLQSPSPPQFDLRDPILATTEGGANDISSQEDSGFNIFSRSAGGPKSLPNRSQPPDVALEFSQRIFGWDKNPSKSDPVSPIPYIIS
jgi:hypothetical protein